MDHDRWMIAFAVVTFGVGLAGSVIGLAVLNWHERSSQPPPWRRP